MISKYENYVTGKTIEIEKDKTNELYKTEIIIKAINKENKMIHKTITQNCLTNTAIKSMFYNLNRGMYSLDDNTFNLSSFGNLLLINNDELVEDKKIDKIDLEKDEVVGFANTFFTNRTYNPIQGTIDKNLTVFDETNGEITICVRFSYDKANGAYSHICFVPSSEYSNDKAEPIYWANKPIEKIILNEGINDNLKFLVFNNKGNPIYLDKNNKIFYNAQINNIGVIKSINKGIKLKDIKIDIEGDIVGFIYNNQVGNYLIICDKGWGNVGAYEFDNNLNYLRKYEDFGVDSVDFNNRSNKCLFFNNYLLFLSNPENQIKIHIYKLNDKNGIDYINTKLIKVNVEDVTCISANKEYIYINYKDNVEDLFKCKILEMQEVNKEGSEDVDIVFKEVITNNVSKHRYNNIFTYNYPLNNSFITELMIGYNSYDTYISTSIYGYGTISKLPVREVKTSNIEILVLYKFIVDMQDKGIY